jgi:hypothetical protein
MSYKDIKTTEWEVKLGPMVNYKDSMVMSFEFLNNEVEYQHTYYFSGTTTGVGITVDAGSLSGKFTRINKYFSFNDLNYCPGVVKGVGMGFIAGFSLLFVSAGKLFKNKQLSDVNGLKFGASGFYTTGIWVMAD